MAKLWQSYGKPLYFAFAKNIYAILLTSIFTRSVAMAKPYQILTSNTLKTIAISFMIFDHFIAGFFISDSIYTMLLRIPGRIVAPIICFLIAQGYHYTKNKYKYALRLLIFAIISHIPYNIYFKYSLFEATSVMWGLFLGLGTLIVIKHNNLNVFLKFIFIICAVFLSATADWNYVSIVWIVGFGLLFKNIKGQIIFFALSGLMFHIVPTFLNYGFSSPGTLYLYQLGIFLAIPLMMMYNGKLGRKLSFLPKFFYILYPLHLILLYLIRIIYLEVL